MHQSRFLRRVTPLLLLAVLAAACGGSNFESGGDEAAGGGETADAAGESAGEAGSEAGSEAAGGGSEAAAGEGVELELAGFASSPAEDEQLTAILEQYNAQSENTATFNPLPEYDTTLQASLAGGEPPDVFYVNDNRLPDLAAAGALAPAGDNIDNPEDFYPALVEAFTYEGTWYCPAKDFSTLALYYNTDMLSEAGVEPPTNWEELAAAAEALTTDGRVGLALAPEYFRWGVFAEQAGGSITNEDLTEMTAATDPVRTGFAYAQDLYERDVAASPTDVDAGWAGEAFGQEKAAMTIEGNWMVGALANDFPDVNYAVAPLPEGPAGQGTFSFSVCYAVAANAPNPEASWDLVNYLVSPEAQLEFTEQFPVMPSRQSNRDPWLEAHPELEPHLASVEFATAPTFVPGFQEVLDVLNDGIQGVASGNREVDEVLQAADEAGQGILGG